MRERKIVPEAVDPSSFPFRQPWCVVTTSWCFSWWHGGTIVPWQAVEAVATVAVVLVVDTYIYSSE